MKEINTEENMGLQFILGNAGGGKTWYIEHQAAAMASKDMKRQIFVVVPEQFTMQTQRNLVALSERHGLWNIEVQSCLLYTSDAADE